MYHAISKLFTQIKNSPEYIKVFKNFGFLGTIQIANYILPLIVLPYLMNVLGAQVFGQVVFAQAFSQYFIILVEFGFNFSATREVSRYRGNVGKLTALFSSVMMLKLFFLVVSLIILVVITFLFEPFKSFKSLHFATFIVAFGYAVFPGWFLQGIEKMKWITLVNLVSKILSLGLLFFVVRGPVDYLYVPIIQGLSMFVPSTIMFFALPKIYPVKFVIPPALEIRSQFKAAFPIFLSSASSSLYSVANTLLMGMVFNPAFAGYYAFAERIIRACTFLFLPLNNALYPYMSIKMKESPEKANKILTKIILVLTVLTSLACLTLFFGSGLLVYILDESYVPSITFLRILSPIIIFVAISNLIGFQFFFTNGKELTYLKIVFAAGLLNLILFVVLNPLLQQYSAAASLLCAECFIAILFIVCSRKQLFISRWKT